MSGEMLGAFDTTEQERIRADVGVIKACALVLVDAVLNLLQADPHSWSERPCDTCRTISSMVGRPFGCYAYALGERRRREALLARIETVPVRTCWEKMPGQARFCGLAAGHLGPHVWQEEEPPGSIDAKVTP